MKVDVSYLPASKQRELAKIVSVIRDTHLAEMIILFGSYARNEWVEEKYDEEHYRYQSDMDILVIVASKSESTQSRLERDLEHQIGQETTISTPVSIVVHDIEFVSRRLSKAQYFFSDIKKEGIVLFDTQQYQLKDAKELPAGERKKLALEDLSYYFNEADGFKKGVDFYLKEKEFKKAAFLLHQTTERLYMAILLVFTRYKPNTHNLTILRKLTNTLDHRFSTVFVLESPEARWLFKLLCKAYIEARYKPSTTITKEELRQLMDKVDQLRAIGYQLCLEKIHSFTP